MSTKEKEFAYITGFSSNVYKIISAAEARISTTGTPHSYISAMLMALKSLLFFCLDIFEPWTCWVSNSEREITFIGYRELEIASCTKYKYSSVAENNVQTLKVCLQQRSSKVMWNYAWNLMLLKSPGNLHLTLHFSQHDREFFCLLQYFTGH